MAKLVNMKIDPAAEKAKYAEPSTLVESPRYPYGLCLELDDEVMKRLKLAEMPEVGGTMLLTAKVTVTGCRENQYQNAEGKAETRASCSLQITDLGLTAAPDDDEDAGSKLYKG